VLSACGATHTIDYGVGKSSLYMYAAVRRCDGVVFSSVFFVKHEMFPKTPL
jgi:hypothetical protein